MSARASSYDLAVIGGGPGGYVAALRGAQLDCSVALIEEAELGGTCLNRGCIPTKALLGAAQVLDSAEKAARFGIEVPAVSFDLDKVRRHKDRCVKQLTSGVGTLLERAGVEVLAGHGRFLGPNEVSVTGPDGESVVEAEAIVIATGSRAIANLVDGADGENVWTSDDAVRFERVPKSMIVIGAGPTGMEFACIYLHFGAQVTLMEMFDRPLPREDPEVSEVVMSIFTRRGGKLEMNAHVKSIEDAPEGKRVIFERDGREHHAEAEVILIAVGRCPNTEDLGAEAAGMELARQCVCVREGVDTPSMDPKEPKAESCPGASLRTSQDHIYAIGDCIRGIGLAHLAMHEAVAAVEDSQGLPSYLNYNAIPTAMYCHPELASVGLQEHRARELGIEVSVGKFPFAANGRAVTLGVREGFAKIITDPDSGRVLGAAIVGKLTTELIAELTLAVEIGASAEDLVNTIHAHPTYSEVVHEAALCVLGRPLHMPMPRRTGRG